MIYKIMIACLILIFFGTGFLISDFQKKEYKFLKEKWKGCYYQVFQNGTHISNKYLKTQHLSRQMGSVQVDSVYYKWTCVK